MAAQSEEFERAWAQIVADLTSDDDGPFSERPGSDRVDPSADASPAGTDPEQSDSSDQTDSATNLRSADPATKAEDGAAESSSAERAPEPRAASSDPAAFLAGWAEEGHFTPPPPPDLPAGSPATRLGWAGTLGGVATLVLVSLSGWDAPRIVLWAAGLVTLAGFVTLVWQLPESRDDGWDDGAQV